MLLLGRVVVALALAVSGWIHLDLAESYDGIGDQISVGMLFRAQGIVALLVAGWLLVRRRDRLPLLAALAVGVASAAAVILSVYVRLPAVGPFPELYEPVWYDRKTASAVTATIAALGAVVLLAVQRRRQVP